MSSLSSCWFFGHSVVEHLPAQSQHWKFPMGRGHMSPDTPILLLTATLNTNMGWIFVEKANDIFPKQACSHYEIICV